MRGDLLAILREIFERSTFAGRLAYSPDEAAELLGISTELVHDLLRTGQLGSVKAGRRRLIAKHHLEAFLAGEPWRNGSLPKSCPFTGCREVVSGEGGEWR
jgi:excisionase family DNA binding protein